MDRLVFLSLFLLASVAQAQSQDAKVPLDVPLHVTWGNEEYDASVDGLENLWFDMVAKDPQLALQMKDRLDTLRFRRDAAALTGIAIATPGLILITGGFTFLRSSEGRDRNVKSSAVFSGSALVLIGAFLYSFILPDHSDVLEFVDEANRRTPEKPMKMELGVSPLPNGAVAGLTLHF